MTRWVLAVLLIALPLLAAHAMQHAKTIARVTVITEGPSIISKEPGVSYGLSLSLEKKNDSYWNYGDPPTYLFYAGEHSLTFKCAVYTFRHSDEATVVSTFRLSIRQDLAGAASYVAYPVVVDHLGCAVKLMRSEQLSDPSSLLTYLKNCLVLARQNTQSAEVSCFGSDVRALRKMSRKQIVMALGRPDAARTVSLCPTYCFLHTTHLSYYFHGRSQGNKGPELEIYDGPAGLGGGWVWRE